VVVEVLVGVVVDLVVAVLEDIENLELHQILIQLVH
tara:strand:+ start:61 stop:168 length:108 start_codon:yes stop_codon:yes gene_type:complete